MKKYERIILILLIVALLAGILAFCGYRFYAYLPLRNAVFGHSYSTALNIYATFFANYIIEYPSYAVSAQGVAYCNIPNANTGNDYSELGKLKPIRLTVNNFDNCIQGAGWTTEEVDAAYIRERAAAAWRCFDADGWTTYFILLENGDVFLCHGSNDNGIVISRIYLLHNLGDPDIFFEKHG